MVSNNARAHFFNLRAVVTQTGLNPATIRAWERRYGLPSPTRTEGGHRQYTQHDIDTLNWLVERQEEGISISHAIQMWRDYVDHGADPLEDLVDEASARPAPIVAGLEGRQICELRQAWIDACLDFNREQAEQVLSGAFAQYNPETVAIEVLQKGLAAIGNGWYEGSVTVQQEHFASALSVQRLEILIAASPPPSRRERIVIATAPRDYHVFGPLLLTFMLRRRGWDVVYLGADVPAEEMGDTMLKVGPSLVIVSAQLLYTAATLKGIAVHMLEHGVPLAYGGSIFNRMPDLVHLVPGHFLGPSLEEAIGRASELAAGPVQTVEWADDAADACAPVLLRYRERRAAVESYIWEHFTAAQQPTRHLAEINQEVANTIEAALLLGDCNLLPGERSWIEYLLMGYRLPAETISSYVQLYYEAAQQFLGEEGEPVVNWLASINGE